MIAKQNIIGETFHHGVKAEMIDREGVMLTQIFCSLNFCNLDNKVLVVACLDENT